MNIAEVGPRSKAALSKVPTDVLYVLALILAALGSFGLGVLYERDAGQGSDFKIEYSESQPASAAAAVPDTGAYVASKSGTKYHLPTCPGAKTISEGNKIWFASKADAEAAGYAPAANCPGM